MMRAFFGKSLLYRLLGSMVIANMVVLLFLLIMQIMDEVTIDISGREMQLKDALVVMERHQAQEEVVMLALALSSFYEWYAGTPNLIELWTHDNQRLYFNQKRVTFAYAPLIGASGKVTKIIANDKKYNLIRQDGKRWSLRMAIPEPPQPFYEYVLEAANTDLLFYSQIVLFPFVMLGLWFAVARGLRPLTLLSEKLAQRNANDLSPLHFDAKYAELKPTVAAFDSLLERLRNKLAQEQDFIQDAGQKLRLPMAEIGAQVQVLVSATSASEKARAEQHIDVAIAATSHLVQQLLDMARVDGLQVQNNQALDCAQVVRGDMAENAPRAISRQIELELDAPPVLLHRIDRAALQLIFHNLLDNAIRYNDNDNQRWVVVSLQKNGDNLVLAVADNGPGIAEAERERVFERFYRYRTEFAEPSDGGMLDVFGTSLGLSIVWQVAAKLGGSVQLTEGLQGQGCRFVVTLPASMTDMIEWDIHGG